jgi:hypothetical protein
MHDLCCVIDVMIYGGLCRNHKDILFKFLKCAIIYVIKKYGRSYTFQLTETAKCFTGSTG